MKKKQILKIILLSTGILACISIPIVLYFTIAQKNSSTGNKVNLQDQSISYLATVQHMNSITEQEATKIKNDIQNKTTNKMTNLNLEKDIDYTINNLDTIQANSTLKDINITITSVASSTKAIGSLTITLNVQEDITTWSIETIDVPANQADSLDAITANNIQRNITIKVDDLLNENQTNTLDYDYEIINFNLIKTGAKFTDYNTQIIVKAITSQTNLKGQFSINFQLK